MKKTLFDKNFIDSQRKKLEEEKIRITKELESIGNRSKENPEDFKTTYDDYGKDEESNAAEFAQYETNLSIENQLEQELQRVGGAILRIEKGTYGFDINTGEPIEKKRLEAYPAAETAI